RRSTSARVKFLASFVRRKCAAIREARNVTGCRGAIRFAGNYATRDGAFLRHRLLWVGCSFRYPVQAKGAAHGAASCYTCERQATGGTKLRPALITGR